MLTQLHIRNLAVVDAAELELGPGFTVLTGETGAGKSIVVEALALALGERADTRAIRAGADRLEVSAGFELPADSALRHWLATHDLEEQDECLLRRVITAEGRSRGYVNGQPATMQMLQEIGDLLLDICGQQAHQRLRHRAVQRELLDRHGGHLSLVSEVSEAHRVWRDARDRQADLASAGRDMAARRELLGFQIQELDALALGEHEYAELELEFQRLAHAGRIGGALAEALNTLYESDETSAHDLVGRSRQDLSALAELDPALGPVAALLGEAEALLAEAADGLRDGLARNEHDPGREEAVGDRLAAARGLARKHRCEPGELPALRVRLERELAELDSRDERLADFEAAAAEARMRLESTAARLSRARSAAAERLAAAVTANMQQLGMTGGRFSVRLSPNPDRELAAFGAENVLFEVAANPGQPPGALARVASGGELSRISLALQVVAANAQSGTLVFDEVDAGVGGGVAEIVGRQLQALSRTSQVLCVTHLPQVACHANRHFKVSKITDGQFTRTAVKPLTDSERVEEIARMLGGVEITERSRAHAREMLDLAAGLQAG